MSYPVETLRSLRPLLDPEDREGTAYFELHPAELPHPGACWLQGSLFMQDVAFDFFIRCFEAVRPSFDHFSSERFGRDELARLTIELDAYLGDLAGQPSRELVFSRFDSVFTPDLWKGFETEVLASALRSAGRTLRGFVAEAGRTSGCLWVLGM